MRTTLVSVLHRCSVMPAVTAALMIACLSTTAAAVAGGVGPHGGGSGGAVATARGADSSPRPVPSPTFAESAPPAVPSGTRAATPAARAAKPAPVPSAPRSPAVYSPSARRAVPAPSPSAPPGPSSPAATAAGRQSASDPQARTPAAGADTGVSALQRLAHSIVPAGQYASFAEIISHESGWDVTATNSSSGAYGLGQALPASQMARFGADWRSNPVTQLKWALSYMNSRYGSPNAAWAFWSVHHWY